MTSEGLHKVQYRILAALIAAENVVLRSQGIEVSSVTLPVRHTTNWRETDGQGQIGTSRSLSLSGMVFESPSSVPIGANLEIDVELPEGKHLVGIGEVLEVAGSASRGWTMTVRFGAAEVRHEAIMPRSCPDASVAIRLDSGGLVLG